MADRLHRTFSIADGIHGVLAWSVTTLDDVAATQADVGKVARVVREGSTEYASGVVELHPSNVGGPVNRAQWAPGDTLYLYPFLADGAQPFMVLAVLPDDTAGATLKLRVQSVEPGALYELLAGENSLASPPPGWTSYVLVLDDGVRLGSSALYVLQDFADGSPVWRELVTRSVPPPPEPPVGDPGITVEQHAALMDAALHGIVRWTVGDEGALVEQGATADDVGKVALVGIPPRQAFVLSSFDGGVPSWLRLTDPLVELVTLTTSGMATSSWNRSVRIARYNATAPGTLIISPDSARATEIGDTLTIVQVGYGQLTITPGSGVTLLPGEMRTRGRGAEVTLRKTAANTWDITGDVARAGLGMTWADAELLYATPIQNGVGMNFNGMAGGVSGQTARSVAPTNALTRRTRTSFVSAATAGSFVKANSVTNILTNDGLHYSGLMGIGVPSANWRWFFGLANAFSNNLSTGEPGSVAYNFGIGTAAGTNNVCIIGAHNNVPGSIVDLGASFPARAGSAGAVYSLEVDVDKGGSYWRWQVDRLDVPARATGVAIAGTGAPTASLGMSVWLIANNVTDAVAIDIQLMHMGVAIPIPR